MGSRGIWTDILEGAALIGSFIPNPVVKVLSIGVGMVISSLGKGSDQAQSEGETYSWSQAPNKTAANGTPMPVIYGKTRVKPILKNRYITMEGKKQYLYALYSFACHAIDQRYVAEWTVGTHYVAGDEVSNPSEPGKTYVCKYAHTAYAITHPVAAQFSLFDVDGGLNPVWEEGKGTAAITGIQVNGENVEALHQYGVEYWTRPGLPQQAVLPAMSQTFANNAQEDDVNGIYPTPMHQFKGSQTFAVTRPTMGWLSHFLYYDGVVYKVASGGGTYALNMYIYWTKPTDPTVTQTSYTTSVVPLAPLAGRFLICTYKASSLSFVFEWTSHTPAAGDWHVYDITTGTTQNIQIEMTLPNGLISPTNDPAKPTTTALGKVFIQYRMDNGDGTFGAWTSGISASRDDNGKPFDSTRDWGNGLVEGTLMRETTEAITIVKQVAYAENPLAQGRYQVRVAAFVAGEVVVTNVAAITYGDFTYPGEPLLAIKVLASNKFNGDIEVTAVCERSTVWVYNTRSSAWVEGNANNPAWAAYDLLAQGNMYHPATRDPSIGVGAAGAQGQMATYGCGIHLEKLDYESFRAWATHLGTLEFTLNTVFDDFTTVWDAIQRICSEFRGIVMPMGSKYYAITDKAETPSQLFSMGNIVEGSFQGTWVDRSKRAGSVELTYFDAANAYKQTTFLIRGTDWTTQEVLRMTLYGTTGYDQAYKIGRYFLKCNELLTNTVEFEVGVSELQAGVGDVVYVQHDVPKWWGNGGRVISYTFIPDPGAWAVVLDKSVVLEVGYTYDIYLKHQDTDVVEVKRVTSPAGTTMNIFTGAWVTTPKTSDVWAIVSTAAPIQKFRIIDIVRSSELNKRLTLLAYDPDVYETGLVAPPLDNGIYKVVTPAYNIASNLRLSEMLSKRSTGEYQSNINVAWEAGQGENWGEWDVVFRDVDAGDLGWRGEWDVDTVYALFDKVEHDGRTYISLSDNNTGRPLTI